MQHDTGPLAIECHERCARFHILALHFERDRPGFSIAMEEQQLMNSEELLLDLDIRFLILRQPFKVSRNFTRTSAIATSRPMSSRCVYIIVSSIFATNANGTTIFHLLSSPIRFSSSPPSFASLSRQSPLP